MLTASQLLAALNNEGLKPVTSSADKQDRQLWLKAVAPAIYERADMIG